MPSERSRAGGPVLRAKRRAIPSLRRRAMGWALALVSFVVFVSLPIVFAGNFNQWGPELSAPNNFAGTTTVWPTVVQSEAGVTLVDVRLANILGYNPTGGQNVYRTDVSTAFRIAVPPEITRTFHIHVPSDGTFVQGPDLQGSEGACCAGDTAVTVIQTSGVISSSLGLTLPGLQHAEGQIVAAPGVTELLTIPTDPGMSQLSDKSGTWSGGFWTTTFDFTLSALGFYTRPFDDLNWQLRATVPADNPAADNNHWDAKSNDDSLAAPDKVFVNSRNSGPVQISQVDAAAGFIDWTVPVDNTGAPADFQYQLLAGPDEITLTNDATGLAVAFAVPNGPAGTTRVGMLASVGLSQPATMVQSIDLAGAVGDHQVLYQDGSIVTLHRTDPDGTGVETTNLNFGDLSGPPIVMQEEDNTRNATWINLFGTTLAAPTIGPPLGCDQIVGSSVAVVESDPLGGQEGLGSVRYGTLTVPAYFDTFESGDTRFWSGTVP